MVKTKLMSTWPGVTVPTEGLRSCAVWPNNVGNNSILRFNIEASLPLMYGKWAMGYNRIRKKTINYCSLQVWINILKGDCQFSSRNVLFLSSKKVKRETKMGRHKAQEWKVKRENHTWSVLSSSPAGWPKFCKSQLDLYWSACCCLWEPAKSR